MAILIIKRLFYAAIVMLAVAFVAFLIFQFLGDPAQMLLGQQATVEDLEKLRHRLGLDRGFFAQYLTYLGHALQGDFGISYFKQRDVMSLILERLPATVELVLVSTVVALAVGTVFGVHVALHPRTAASQAMRLFSFIGISTPQFVIGIVLILIFSVSLRWLPAFGRGEVVALGNWWTTGLLTGSGRIALIMPVTAMALYQVSFIMRLMTAEMTEVLRTDHIKFSRARGLPDRIVHYRHAVKNCLMPVATMTGLLVGDLIAFAMVTETVFQWPGLGLLFVEAVTLGDRPIIAAYLMVASFIIVSINTLVDIAYIVIDPRLRVSGKGGRSLA